MSPIPGPPLTFHRLATIVTLLTYRPPLMLAFGAWNTKLFFLGSVGKPRVSADLTFGLLESPPRLQLKSLYWRLYYKWPIGRFSWTFIPVLCCKYIRVHYKTNVMENHRGQLLGWRGPSWTACSSSSEGNCTVSSAENVCHHERCIGVRIPRYFRSVAFRDSTRVSRLPTFASTF